ncbi:cation-translocating P-type ATPase [Candidatus Thorarchaeota archaeon]|nr:MAG: cation-translocating P-type ATPase [Candidatus Thorarchaeota archaeon]
MAQDHWYDNDIEHVVRQLDTSLEGLSELEAQSRLAKYGSNELTATGGISPLRMFLQQFRDPMVIILIIAIGISLVTEILEGEGLIDAIVIFSIVIFNAIFGFVQEYKSEQALEALKQMAAPKARVMRDGLWKITESRNIVPGDLIGLDSGDLVPADARVVYAVGFSADEAPLTGESIAVRKITNPIHLRNPVVGDMKNLVFQGTTITAGKGNAIVTSTGMRTQFGKIATLVQESDKDMTPLQLDLDDLGKKLGALIVVLCILVFGAEIIKNVSDSVMEELLAAIALAVSAIPEGLPAVVTITLAIGVQRMVARNAIVRRLPSVETLGATTVICSDKTGTITKNEMPVTTLFTNGMTISVSGVGYKKRGQFTRASEKFDPLSDVHVSKLLEIGQLCTNSLLQPEPSGKSDWTIVGDPTEGALLVLAEKAGLAHESTLAKFTEITEISFDSARKRMTSITSDNEGNIIAFSKGAPEVLLPLCTRIFENGQVIPLTDEMRASIVGINAGLAENALRVLSFAYRPLDEEIPDWEPEKTERDLIFVGLIGMMDPPRNEVSDAIRICKVAGIRPIMITGDHKLTARSIAVDVGLIERDGHVISGAEIDEMSEQEFMDSVRICNVFARVAPEHKLRIVNALKASREVVAMTGDGVNDAPAIKAADVGISMGIRGSDVTKEASDVILTDDNFATIVSAVEKGREIYSNIRKFVRFLLAANFDEVFLIFTIIMLGLPLPITAIQILWLNLATDGFPALALGVDPPEEGVMDRSPRKPGAKMMDRGMATFIITAGFVAFLASVSVFLVMITIYGGWIPGITGVYLDMTDETLISPITGLYWTNVLKHARTAVFASVVCFELLFVWNCRDEYHPIWRTTIRKSTVLMAAVALSAILTLLTIYFAPLQVIFETMPLNPTDWALIIITCIPALLIPPHIIFGHHKEKKRKLD